MTRPVLALLVGFLVAVAIGGWGHESRPAQAGQPAAAAAVRALTSDAPEAFRQMPADFATVMRFTPAAVVVAGRVTATRSDGGCSSPFGGTPYHFTSACRQHDLGYDLLRYANRKGQPLGPWARRAIDTHFARQTLGQCQQGWKLGCRFTAEAYIAMIRFNSWRQGDGPPVFEPMNRILTPVGGGLLVAVLIGLVRWPGSWGAGFGWSAAVTSRIRYPFRWLEAAVVVSQTGMIGMALPAVALAVTGAGLIGITLMLTKADAPVAARLDPTLAYSSSGGSDPRRLRK